MRIHSLFQNYKNDKQGSAAVEFSLVGMGFLLLIFSVIESGRLFATWNAFQYSFDKATRTLLVDSEISEEDLQEMIIEDMSILAVDEDSVTITRVSPDPVGANGIQFIDIEGTYTYQIIVPFLPESWNSFQLTAHSRLPHY